MAKHIFQDHRAALERRKPHESAETHCGNLVVPIGRIWSGDHVESHLILHCRRARATAKEIERSVMGDPKQPAFEVIDDTDHRLGVESLDHRILDDVLAIDGRASHPRAISMELGTELTQHSFKVVARMVSHLGPCPLEYRSRAAHMSSGMISLLARKP